MGWLTTIVKHVDYVRGRYDAFPARDARARAGVFEVLDEVRRKELKRVHGSSSLESAAFADADIPYELYALKDSQTDAVIGCARVVTADQIAAIPASREEYHLDRFPLQLLPRVLVVTRLAVLQPFRKTAASLVMFRRLYDDALANGMLVSLLSCEPGLYAGYLRLGFRPFGGVHQGASGGFRIPMVAIHHDVDYLRLIKSPMHGRLVAVRTPLPQDAIDWYRELEVREGTIDPGVAFYSDAGHGVHAQLTQGLSPAGREQLLRNAMQVRCRHGDVILKIGDGGRSMGFVLRGAVQEQGPRIQAMLGEGELFGEMAMVLDQTREANVVAVGDGSRVLLLSQSCLERLKKPEDVAQVWQNLARVLARRARLGHE